MSGKEDSVAPREGVTSSQESDPISLQVAGSFLTNNPRDLLPACSCISPFLPLFYIYMGLPDLLAPVQTRHSYLSRMPGLAPV